MFAVNQPVKRMIGLGIGGEIGLLQRAGVTRKLTADNFRRKHGRTQHLGHDFQRLGTARHVGQRTQRESGAIRVITMTHRSADIGQTTGDFILAHIRSALTHQCIGNRRQTGFVRCVERRAGGDIDGNVEHRQSAVGDKINFCSSGCTPMFDRQYCVGQLSDRQQRQGAGGTDQRFHVHTSSHDELPRAARPVPVRRSAAAGRDKPRSARHRADTGAPHHAPARR